MESRLESALIRAVSLASVVGMVFFIPFAFLPLTTMALGQGHFALAYIYQVEGGHISRLKFIVLLISAAAFVAFAMFGSLPVLIFVNGVWFVIHFSVDEARLLNGKHSLFTTLEAFPFVTLLTGILAQGYLIQDWFPQTVFLSAACLFLYGVLMARAGRLPNATSYAFYALTLLIFGLYVCVRFTPEWAGKVFWALGLLHFAIWYGVYWFKLKRASDARNKFVLRALCVNVMFLGCAVLWYTNTHQWWVFGLFFGTSYYVWSLLHGIASLRPSEVRASVKLGG